MKDDAVIVGIDEAGRGALAGPVVAGACLLIDALETHPFITDSKALSPAQREHAFAWIEQNCTYGYGFAGNDDIDSLGILGATEKAMHAALAMLEQQITPTYLLIDGRDKFWFNYPHSSVIKGDEKEPCISAGSIIAKVLRDRWMVEKSAEFPEYGFAGHKGYGSAEHFACIEKYGVCELHRKSFLRKSTA